MKKNNYVKVLLLTCLVALLAISLAACGGKKADKDESADQEPAQTETQEEPEEKTIEKYFTDHPDELEEIKKTVNESEEMKKALEVLDFDVYAKDNVLVYEYKFKQTYDEAQIEALKPSISDTLDKMEEEMTDRIGTIETGYGVDNVVIHIIYMNGDGTVIGEKEYSK